MHQLQNSTKWFLLLGLCWFLGTASWAQKQYSSFVHESFQGTRIINGHSVETLADGEMEMIIGHRFGRINGGFYELFGLDQSSIRLGLDYGIKDWLNIGVGRSSLGKEYDGFIKLRLLRQTAPGVSGMPVSVSFFSSASYRSLRASDPERPLAWQNRMAYTHQLLIARKFGDRFAVQLMPTVLHYNLVELAGEANDKISIGVAAKYQLTKNLAITAEYHNVFLNHKAPGTFDPISIGLDLNTGSHVFQLHFTNAAGMIEKQFIGETTGDISAGDIHFGFNMVRTFKLKGRRY